MLPSLSLAVLLWAVPTVPVSPLDESEEVRILLQEGRGILPVDDRRLEVGCESTPRAQPAIGPLGLRCARGALQGAGCTASASATLEGAEGIRVAGRALRGRLEVACAGDRFTAINVLPLEVYLGAVLASEMPRTFPLEALKAQAVAARSYAVMRKMEARELGRRYHLGSTVLSQVYQGLSQEDPRTRTAVDATRGEVLATGVTPVEAYFHASCGGRTESGAAALGRPLGYLVPVSCPCGARSPYAHWKVDLTAAELGRALGTAAPGEVRISARTATGRAATLALSGNRVDRSIAASEFRAAVGYQRLPSLWFDVHRSGDTFTFEGKGSGHGAGLCQWGARVLAEQGRSYREILAHYYTDATVHNTY